MARSISTIQAQIIANIRSQPNLSGLSSTSNVAIWRLLTWVVATAINLLEQLWDIFQKDIENIASNSITGNAAWLRQQVLNFQFGYVVTINPQTFAPSYSILDTTAQIVARCSVTQGANFTVNVKVATLSGGSLTTLSTDQQNALQAYLDEINFAGVGFTIINQAADYIYVTGTVYYNGQYTGIINSAVITALNNYLASLSSATNFNGTVYLKDIEEIILGVPGVTDVFLVNVWCRPAKYNGSSTSFGDGSTVQLLNSSAELYRNYQTAAGYIINEASPNDFAGGLTFTIDTSQG